MLVREAQSWESVRVVSGDYRMTRGQLWDMATGQRKITFTGHIHTVRAICISDRHPYMFSVGDDKKVLCWDLEQNKVIRSYHGHLSGVFSAALHPTLDLLFTGGRDSSCRVCILCVLVALARLSTSHAASVRVSFFHFFFFPR